MSNGQSDLQSARSSLPPQASSSGKALNIVLWILQAILAVFFVTIGSIKFLTPAERLAQMFRWTGEHPTLVIITATSDILIGLGLLLPALTRIAPRLTVIAIVGGCLLQLCAITFHLSRGEPITINLVILPLLLFLLWGRGWRLPISARRRTAAE